MQKNFKDEVQPISRLYEIHKLINAATGIICINILMHTYIMKTQ